MTRLIVFLIRRKLGLRKGEHFRFTNQRTRANYYYFDSSALRKVSIHDNMVTDVLSDVPINWLLSDDCSIQKTGIFEPMDEVV